MYELDYFKFMHMAPSACAWGRSRAEASEKHVEEQLCAGAHHVGEVKERGDDEDGQDHGNDQAQNEVFCILVQLFVGDLAFPVISGTQGEDDEGVNGTHGTPCAWSG